MPGKGKAKPKGGNKGEDFTGKNKYDKDWPPIAPQKPIKKARLREHNKVNEA